MIFAITDPDPNFTSPNLLDIPNVDILIVENAERFGLSALHQLRGRIGRKGSNNTNSHCILLSQQEHFNATSDPSAPLKRLDILRESMSGQQIAEADFMLRGPGDLLGNAQSGLFEGKVVDADHHWEMLRIATTIGRAFSENQTLDTQHSEVLNPLTQKLRNGELHSFYDQTAASSDRGFTLRVMMALFADDWGNGEEGNERGALHSIALLQKMATLKEVSDADKAVQQKIVSLLQSLPDANSFVSS